MAVLDFLARQEYFLDHLAPIWNGMEDDEWRGVFYLPKHCHQYAARVLKHPSIVEYIEDGECGSQPILTCAYGDAVRAAEWDAGRSVILMEHGVGLTFGKGAYADGLDRRVKMALFPVPNKHTQDRVHPELKSKPHPIVGVPKLDPWAGEFSIRRDMPRNPVVAVSFHHGSKMSRPAETGSAWEHYIDYLPELAKKYKLVVHCHPLLRAAIEDKYAAMKLEYVSDFNVVMHLADIYLNDASSTLYEFLVTGKPVVVLNAPWFDKKSKWGLRFWEYSDIGPQVDFPEQLPNVIDGIIERPDDYRPQRSRAVSDLFPYLGQSVERTITEIYERGGII